MIAKTGFPQYLESIAIGTSPDFLKNRTDLCDVVSDFPQEVNLTYLWKKINISKEPIKELRTFSKHFMLDGPDLDPEFILHYVDKVKGLNPWLSTQITRDVQQSLDIASKSAPPTNDQSIIYDDPETEIASRDFDPDSEMSKDSNFLDKLANLMNSCKAPGNYFAPISDKIGGIFDFGRMNSIGTSLVQDGNLSAPPPIGIGTNMLNKIPAAIQEVLFNAYTGAKIIADTTKSVFIGAGEALKIAKLNKEGIGADRGGMVPIGATSTSLFQDAMMINSKMMSKVRTNLKDNFRVYDHLMRYNAFDTQMNLAKAARRSLKVKMRTPYSDGKEVEVGITPQGTAAGAGRELSENNVTPRQALKPCTSGNAKKHDDTPKQNKSTHGSQLKGGANATGTGTAGDNGKKISDTAKQMVGTSTREIPGTQNGTLGCATAVSMMFKQATGEDILPGRPIVMGTSDLYFGLMKDSRFVAVPIDEAQPGDILVTARGRVPGHTVIMTENNIVVGNSSNSGKINRQDTLDYFKRTVVTRNPSQSSAFRYVGR